MGTSDANRDGRLDVAATSLRSATIDPTVRFFDGLTGADVFSSFGGGARPDGAARVSATVSGGRA